jgi:hypothetical protein
VNFTIARRYSYTGQNSFFDFFLLAITNAPLS